MSIKASITVKIKLRRLERFKSQVAADLQNSTQGPVRKALKQWAVRYRSFLQERFDAYSKGGGDWPPLSPATIARRRSGSASKTKKKTKPPPKQGAISSFFQYVLGKKTTESKKPEKKKKKVSKKPAKKKEKLVAILRDLGILYAVLSPTFSGKPGSLEVHEPFGVTIGYGGPHKHGDGKVTIADIASFHQTGDGVPQRKIIVPPVTSVLTLMADDMRRALRKMKE